MTKMTPKLVAVLAGGLIALAACGSNATDKPAGADPPAAATAISRTLPASNIGTLHSAGVEPTDVYQQDECMQRVPRPC